jgi:hypothetical protein
LAATCSRTGSVTDGGNQRASQAAPRAVVVVGAGHQLAAAQFAGVREGVGAAQVTGVVQQRGGDEGGRRAPGGRQCPGLQQVLRDRDRLPEVLPGAFGREQLGQPARRRHDRGHARSRVVKHPPPPRWYGPQVNGQ